MMGKKQMLMARVAMAAAACGIDMNRIIIDNKGMGMQVGRDGGYPKEDPKGSREVQDKKILDAKIKRVKKAMTRNRCSKEEIQIAIDAIKIENNEQYNSNCWCNIK